MKEYPLPLPPSYGQVVAWLPSSAPLCGKAPPPRPPCPRQALMEPAVLCLPQPVAENHLGEPPSLCLSLRLSSRHNAGLRSALSGLLHICPLLLGVLPSPASRSAGRLWPSPFASGPQGTGLGSFWKVPDSAGTFFLAAAGQLGCGPL